MLPLRRSRWWILIVWLGISSLSAAELPQPARPNILCLVAEDLSPLLACYGDRTVSTPILDQLAREGVVFDRCFTLPVCAPSRFSLITGTHAVSSGPAQHMRASGKVPGELTGFPAALREAGYYTVNNAKTDYNAPISLAETWDESSRRAHWRQRARPEQPFFAVFNFELTHESCLFPVSEPDQGNPPIDPARVRIPPYQPDTPEIRADWARQYHRLVRLDRELGKRLDELAADQLSENTIVLFDGDNGGVTPRSKRFLHASGTRVPLIMRFPPRWQHLAPGSPGSRVASPVSFVDFAPTLLSLADVPGSAHLQGRAFAGKSRATNEFVFLSRDRMDELYDLSRGITDGRWLYLRNFRPDVPYVQPLEYMFRARGYQSWAQLAAAGRLTPQTSQFWGTKPVEELYDLAEDPDNVKNLAAHPASRATRDRMRSALRDRVIDLRDQGFLPEGSATEGWDSVRRAGAFPMERIYELAVMASESDPAQIPEFRTALTSDQEAIRWWGAQGCTLLGRAASTVRSELELRLRDDSPAVQVVAAEALLRIGDAPKAAKTLRDHLCRTPVDYASVQAANVALRHRDAMRQFRDDLATALERVIKVETQPDPRHYLRRALQRLLDELDGKVQPLRYPNVSQPE